MKKLLVVTIFFVSVFLIHEIFIPVGWSSTKTFAEYEEKVLDLEARAKSVEVSARAEKRYLNELDKLGVLIKNLDHSFSHYYDSSKIQRDKEIKSISLNIANLEKEILLLERKLL